MPKTERVELRLDADVKKLLDVIAGQRNCGGVTALLEQLIQAEIDHILGGLYSRPISKLQLWGAQGLAARARLCLAYLLANEGKDGFTFRPTWREETPWGPRGEKREPIHIDEFLVIAPNGKVFNPNVPAGDEPKK